ncbi:MAG: putative membrane spanning protein [Candidatus Woesebacteria bacterium GW2011_GWB1_39_10b]|uniref:Putative membrane spanning protein n=1 Tax=Candidatus Woesebacteria bacterium GW2011_GWB1_39_10b TaxID=1618573 RepID=A0A0G0LMW2_9BACT|nr:MAG: putative membrane spanning protein [Candidatus Woesebacteria bacterium GW2011_GWB1_39_10b]
MLILINALVWIALFTYPDKNLRLIACDVGRGDAILAIYGKVQILTDGGPDSKVLECLSRHLPFYDRKIEGIIISHPQKDHFGGLIDVIKRYDVDFIIATPLDSGSQEWRVLKSLVGSKGVKVINPQSGQKLRLGLIYLDILWPQKETFLASENSMLAPASSVLSGQASQEVNGVLGAFTSKRDPNDFSVVSILSFKDFDALLTGDISPGISNTIAEELTLSGSRRVDYLKVPHHGSKNGLTKGLVDATNPEVAVISSGKNNSYGHPHKEILKILGDKDIKILRTDELGDVVIESNGKNVWVRK